MEDTNAPEATGAQAHGDDRSSPQVDYHTAREAAHHYRERGWRPIPLPAGSKKPTTPRWQHLSLSASELDRCFPTGANIGILLGEPSGGLVDVDLDCAEAVAAAAALLPPTDMISGRGRNPRSHYWYVVDAPPAKASTKWVDPTATGANATLVELRSSGGQTCVPPSVVSEQVEGVRCPDTYIWHAGGDPARVDVATLRSAVARLAAAALIARYWPAQGARHDAAMAWAGVLSGGVSLAVAQAIIGAAARAAGDDEPDDRLRAVAGTYARIAQQEPATGAPTLEALGVDARVIKSVRSWLFPGVAGEARGGDRPPAGERGRGTAGHETAAAQSQALPYVATPDGISRRKAGEHGETLIPLCNFQARVIADIAEDDGSGDLCHTFEVEGMLAGRVSRFMLPAEKFAAMHWPMEEMGFGAIVFPGQGTKDHARVAIQMLSGSVVSRRVFTHTGWRDVEGRPVFLHGGGAIGADGHIADVAVRLAPPLDRYALPSPPTGEERAEAIRASLGLMTLAPDAVMAPLLGAAYRSVLGSGDFAVHVAGPTGAGKSELAALIQQHFGARFDRQHLPAAWSSTGNALEGMAFLCKDALLVVDDFAPGGSQTDVARYHREAERLLRAQGNTAGRARMRPDGGLRAARYPRGLILSTGEDVPKGQSVRARLLVIEVTGHTLNWDRLTSHQNEARTGRYAAAMAGFLQWLAARKPELDAGLRAESAGLRDQAVRDSSHRRTPGIVADLAAGWQWWLRYAVDAGALTAKEKDELWDRVWLALGDAAAGQAAHQGAQEPAARFLELLRGVLASGQGHIIGVNGSAPPNELIWGWRNLNEGVMEAAPTSWRAMGQSIGWVAGDDLYLEPNAVYAAVQRLARDQGDSLAVTSTVLWKRLDERGLLVSREAGRGRLTMRRMVGGARREVLHLAVRALYPEEPSQPSQPSQPEATRASAGSDVAVPGTDSWDGFCTPEPESSLESVPHGSPAEPARPAGGTNGTIGTVPRAGPPPNRARAGTGTATDPEMLAALRADVLEAAAAAGFPRTTMKPGVSVAAGEESWRRWLDRAGDDDLVTVLSRLQTEKTAA